MTLKEDKCSDTKIARIHVAMCCNRDRPIVPGEQMTEQFMIPHFEIIVQMLYH